MIAVTNPRGAALDEIAQITREMGEYDRDPLPPADDPDE